VTELQAAAVLPAGEPVDEQEGLIAVDCVPAIVTWCRAEMAICRETQRDRAQVLLFAAELVEAVLSAPPPDVQRPDDA
jgi:hypothetical protein